MYHVSNAELAVRVETNRLAMLHLVGFECRCCGSRDVYHDVAACEQAAYVAFCEWREEQGSAEYFEAMEAELEQSASDGIPAGCFPANGLY